MGKILRFIITWVCYFLAYVSMVLGAGAILGGLVFSIVGIFTSPEIGAWTRLHEGMWLGFRYAAVWAGGVAIVLCFMQGYRTRKGCPKRT